MAIDISRETSSILLPPEISSEIWQRTQEESVVMRLSQQMPIPGGGTVVPMISGDPTAEWVNETDEIPVSRPTFHNKMIRGYKLATIVPFSNEFRRDVDSLYSAVVRRLPGVFAEKFDATVFGQPNGAPGSDFDTLGGITSVSIANDTYDALVTADAAVAVAGGILNGWVIAPQARSLLLTAKDEIGRPIFINNVTTDGSVPALLGAPTYMSRTAYFGSLPTQVGFAADWSGARYGVVNDITISISDQASITDGSEVINLWERDMFAVRVLFEVGFRVRDLSEFVKLTG